MCRGDEGKGLSAGLPAAGQQLVDRDGVAGNPIGMTPTAAMPATRKNPRPYGMPPFADSHAAAHHWRRREGATRDQNLAGEVTATTLLVIGAGPAGLSTAAWLARSGLVGRIARLRNTPEPACPIHPGPANLTGVNISRLSASPIGPERPISVLSSQEMGLVEKVAALARRRQLRLRRQAQRRTVRLPNMKRTR